jgi:hypothetical protein
MPGKIGTDGCTTTRPRLTIISQHALPADEADFLHPEVQACVPHAPPCRSGSYDRVMMVA